MKIAKLLAACLLLTTVAACSTTGKFVVPEDTNLYLYYRDKPEEVGPSGVVETRPFGWSAIGVPPDGGIPYRLERDGETVKEGRLRAVFRGVSLFWPPYAVIYWPVGLNPHITYDLINDTQK